MESDQAMSILKSLIDLFARGLTAPLCFFPETSYAYAEAFQKNREEARALKAARVKWYPGYYNTGDCEDIYIKTCFGSEMPDSDEFRSIAAEVFEPMLNIILPQRH
jgi:exodeoxyribonuclease V gamma subunit